MHFAEYNQHVTDGKFIFVEGCFLSKTRAKKNRVRHFPRFFESLEPGLSPDPSTEVSTFGVQSPGSVPDSRLFGCRDREGTRSLDVWSAESGKRPGLSTFQAERSGRNPKSRRLERRVREASRALHFSGGEIGKEPEVSTFGVQSPGSVPGSPRFRCRDWEGTRSLDV